MTGENSEIIKLRKYLLGTLESGHEQIEERLMTDDGFFQSVLVEEDELIRDFVRENLSADEVKSFENHFLISEERRKKLTLAQVLRRKSAENVFLNETVETESPQRVSFLSGVKEFFSTYLPKPVLLGLIILLFGGAIAIAVFYSGDSKLNSLENEFVELNKEDFSEIARFEEFSRLNLLSDDTRSANNIESISKQKLTDKVFFRLDLSFQVNDDENFSLELSNSRKTVFKQNQLRSYKNVNGSELRFLIPSSVLEKGEYKIKITGGKNNEAVYLFSVE